MRGQTTTSVGNVKRLVIGNMSTIQKYGTTSVAVLLIQLEDLLRD